MTIIQKRQNKSNSTTTLQKYGCIFIALVICLALFQIQDAPDSNDASGKSKVRRKELLTARDPNTPVLLTKNQNQNRAQEPVKCKEDTKDSTRDAKIVHQVSHKQVQKDVAAATSTISTERDFLDIALKTGTDKVEGYHQLPKCLANPETCIRGESERRVCRPWGHFYDTMYNKWLKKYSTDDAERIQFLEIGFYNGKGFDAYSQFMPRAEGHSIEISCIEDEAKWKWGNFAKKNKRYESLREARRLHCGDSNSYDFLNEVWTKEMKRPDAPPLKLVIEDASHISAHMATSLFFWLPRIEPGGLLVVEDIQPLSQPNPFRTHILPQVIKDLHWCGNKLKEINDTRCFPGIQPLLAGVHCEMHICVFERNDAPSIEPDKENSMTPANAFRDAQKCLFGPHEVSG